MTFVLILGVLTALAATILLFIKVLPAKYDGTFSKKLFQLIHDYFNFKKLYIESILKALFTFFSISSFIGGVLYATIGNIIQLISNLINYSGYGYYAGDFIWRNFFVNFFGGLVFAVIAPIILRLLYEGVMMFILLVKNVIEINNKTKAPEKKED